MTTTMSDTHLTSIAEIQAFLKGSSSIHFSSQSRDEAYQWISDTLCRFKYFTLNKRYKGYIRSYIIKITGYSRSQVARLITRQRIKGQIKLQEGKRNSFESFYTPNDIALLAHTDKAHQRLSGPATKKILQDEYAFGNEEYERIQHISSAHIYNIRHTNRYKRINRTFTKTKKTSVSIGERRKPVPDNRLGFLRIDTVHQGDLIDERTSEKGVYHINVVDEVTQWEIVGSVEGISEHFLKPLLIDLLDQFPFHIINFHSDNGSEYINHTVAKLLNKLLIDQTKSRPRHSNDNGLVETKNGAIVRKHMGYIHIPRSNASKINEFYKQYLNPYLNFYRPSGFASITTNSKGKEKKVYNLYQTPFQALSVRSDASTFLKDGVTIQELKDIVQRMSPNQVAIQMQKAKKLLFNSFTN